MSSCNNLSQEDSGDFPIKGFPTPKDFVIFDRTPPYWNQAVDKGSDFYLKIERCLKRHKVENFLSIFTVWSFVDKRKGIRIQFCNL